MGEPVAPIAGRFLCSAVRYEVREPSSDANDCHCRMCRGTSVGFVTPDKSSPALTRAG